MEREHSGAIPLDFDPGQLLQDADQMLDDSGFESWLVRSLGVNTMDVDTGTSANPAAAAAPPPAAAPRTLTTEGPAAAAPGAAPQAAAAAPGASEGAGVGLVRTLSEGDHLIRLPPGNELVWVGPGLYQLRPAAAPAACPPPPQQQQQQQAPAQQLDPQHSLPPRPSPFQQPAVPLGLPAAQADRKPPSTPQPQAPAAAATPQAAAAAAAAAAQAATAAEVQAAEQQLLQAQQLQFAAPRDPLLSQAQSRLRMAFANANGGLGAGASAGAGVSGAAAAAAVSAGGGAMLRTGSGGSSGSGPQRGAGAGAGGAAGGGAAAGSAAKGGTQKRASSQRFRERQKELIHELEHEVISKLEQVELLSQENDVLKLRSSVLERAVEGREEQLDIMKNFGVKWPDPLKQRAPSATSRNSSETAAAAGAGQKDDTAACCGGGDDDGEGLGLGEGEWWEEPVPTIEEIKRMRAPETKARWRAFLHHASKELVALQAEEDAAGGGGGARDAAAAAAAGAAEAGAAAAHAAGGAAAAAGGGGGGGGGGGLMPYYRGRRPLPQGTPPGSALARIHGLVDRYMSIIKHIVLLNPGATYALVGINLDTGLPQPAPDSFWRGVVSQLRLTPKQIEEIQAMHELYSHSASRVLSERAVLQMRLGSAGVGTYSLRGLLNTTLAMQTAEALAANIKKEHVLRLLLEAFCYGRVFTPVQLARVCVFSYPLLPDVTSITHVICEDAAPLAPGGQRRLVFPHHAAQARAGSMQDAQERIARLAAGGGLEGLPADDAAVAAAAAAAAAGDGLQRVSFHSGLDAHA